MHLVGKMHLVGGGGQMCLNCTVLKTALCRCSCLSSALCYLLASKNQSEVSFHYAQWHNPHLCNSLLKKPPSGVSQELTNQQSNMDGPLLTGSFTHHAPAKFPASKLLCQQENSDSSH